MTPAQMQTLAEKAAILPALKDALECLHECVTAQYRSDCMGAADMAAKACYEVAEQAFLFDDVEGF